MMNRLTAVAFLLASGLTAMAQDRPAYPATRSESVADVLHGVTVSDPYRWLEDGDSEEVRSWTAKQNAFTRAFLDALPGREKLRERLDQLLLTGTVGVPRPASGRYFSTRREQKQNQPVLYVREGVGGPDRVLLDVNALASDGTTALDWYYPSDDGRLLAYGLSVGGSEQSTLRVRDVATGRDLPDVIERTRAASLAWLPDASGFYYTRYPAPGSVPAGEENYHRRVFFHKLGDDPAKDREVFGSGRPKEDWPTIDLSPDGRWLAITQQQGWAKTEVYLIDTTRPNDPARTIVEKVNAVFQVTARNDALYVRTNHEAPKYRVFRIDPARPARENWTVVVPESDDVLERFDVVGNVLVTVSMRKAASSLKYYELAGAGPAQLKREVKLPTIGSVTGLGSEANGRELFYGFQSFTSPVEVRRIDLDTGNEEVWARVTADIDFGSFEVTQVEYPSRDGTKITMFIAARRGLPRDGNNPTLLYGYGGFNISLTPTFSASRFAFLERGGVLAIANLRGGGEYGEEWHQAGMLAKKQNCFDDFIAAAEWLIANKITQSSRLAIQGGSNGGLLMGAALTQRPDLFRAVVCQVPLLDMVRYHKFLIARLWIPEYGSADLPEQFAWLYAYSPYHRVKDGTKYPATLIATAEGDSRVDPLHARKMVARLQAAAAGPNPQLLRLEAKAGHGAGKPRNKTLDELVDVYSFLFAQLGMN